MTKHDYLIISVILGMLLLFAVYQWGNEVGEVELVKAWNDGHSEGFRKAYCDNISKINNVINYIENKASIETPQEKLPLLNEILRLK